MATMPNVEERRNTLRCPIIRIDVEIFCSVDLMLPYRFATARLILRPIAAADAPSIFAGCLPGANSANAAPGSSNDVATAAASNPLQNPITPPSSPTAFGLRSPRLR